MMPTSVARARRRTRQVLLPIVLTALLAAAVDWYVRNDTMDRFLAAAEEVDRTLTEATREIRTVRDRIAEGPSTQPNLGLALQKQAARQGELVWTACQGVLNTSALPWHTALRSARNDFVAHCDAWLQFLSLLAQNWRYVDTPTPAINTTFKAARAAAERAVPPVPLHDADARIARIFAE
jgi:hypothetical protein